VISNRPTGATGSAPTSWGAICSRGSFSDRALRCRPLISVSIAIAIGVPMGLLSGFYGGATDRLMMRVVDLMLTFPGILLALVIIAILGPGLFHAMLAVGISASPTYARVVRATVLSAKSQTYVEAARATGCTNLRIMLRHILPNTGASIIVLGTLGVAGAIIAAAALSYLGLGAKPPEPEWGALLSEGRNYLRVAWWIRRFQAGDHDRRAIDQPWGTGCGMRSIPAPQLDIWPYEEERP
jgi:ABC-type dipeptide/oligopeptide/nickel transport system permease subunit